LPCFIERAAVDETKNKKANDSIAKTTVDIAGIKKGVRGHLKGHCSFIAPGTLKLQLKNVFN